MSVSPSGHDQPAERDGYSQPDQPELWLAVSDKAQDKAKRRKLMEALFDGVDDEKLEAIAAQVGEHMSYISDIRAGNVDPRLGLLQRIVRARGMHLLMVLPH